jgi:hypothetical protein
MISALTTELVEIQTPSLLRHSPHNGVVRVLPPRRWLQQHRELSPVPGVEDGLVAILPTVRK